MTYSQNPPTIAEMEEILFVIRTLEKIARQNIDAHRGVALPRTLIEAIGAAKYCLKDATESPANVDSFETVWDMPYTR